MNSKMPKRPDVTKLESHGGLESHHLSYPPPPKVFNEEKLIREKMKLMAKSHEDKVSELQKKTRELQNEISKMRKESKPNLNKKRVDNLFKHDKKVSKVSSRTASPVSRSRSRSRSRSPLRSRSRSNSPPTDKIISTAALSNNEEEMAPRVNGKHDNNRSPERHNSTSPRHSVTRSPSVSSRSRSSR